MDREDIEMLFRCLMQFLRHLAKKYGFTIKQYSENAEVEARRSSIEQSDAEMREMPVQSRSPLASTIE